MILSQSYRFLSIKITIYFFFCLLLLPNTFASHPQFLCRRDQREALLEVQKEFHVPTTTWNKSIDCCSWDGVQCDDILGEVISLYLDSLNTSSISLKTSSGIFKLQNLRGLGLSKCNLEGEIPSSIGNLSHLTSLSLSYCNLQGEIPSSIGNLSHLTLLALYGNQLVGEVPASIGNLNQLEYIDLRGNELRGNIPTFVSKLVNLGSLFLSHNNFGGRIPSSISKLGNLLYLDLSHNNLGGRVPRSISTLVNLTFIDLSYNKLEGQVPHCIWRPLLPPRGRTGYVDLSHNSFSSFGKSVELGDGSLVTWLDLSSNSLQGPIPHWFCNLRDLFRLDLSNNHLNGSIPQCLTTIYELNLRNSSLSGFMPDFCINGLGLRSLDVSHNNLVGKLPKSLSSCGLEFLNVRGNNFKDTFPFWLGSSSLVVLVLRSNAFYGPIYNISTNLGFPSLRIMDISNNNFVGSLPQDYFANWTDMSSVWSSDDGDPEYMADEHHEHEDSIDLVYKGVDTYFIQIFLGLKAIDFSGNRFSGHIPGSIGLLSGLYLLNLSGNAFTGHIPPSLANITKLEILDLSRNNLSGEIPRGLGKLSFLSYINFSHNHLQGLVPQSTQFGSQNCSSFLDNHGLYGLEEICGKHHVPVPTAQQQPEESLLEPDEPMLNWIAAAIAFGPGVFCGLVIEHIFTSYKNKWFYSS